MKNGINSAVEKWKRLARKLRSEAYALFLAYKHPLTPWYVKIFAGLVVAYTFSPIDLIPDFIPILGYLDDLILVPLGISIAIKMIPAPVMVECRTQAQTALEEGKPVSWFMAFIFIVIWLALAALCIHWLVDLTGAQFQILREGPISAKEIKAVIEESF